MSSPLVRFPAQGCVVEFMHGNKPVQAWIMEAQASQLRLYTINKREMKLAPARLLPWSGPAYASVATRAEIEERLELHRVKREKLAAGIDVLELWELAQGEIAQAEIDWLAGLLWPEPDIDHMAALGWAMLDKKTHFKFSPPHFEIYTEEQVAGRLRQEGREARLAEIAQTGTEFFRKLYDASRSGLKPDDEPRGEIAELLKKMLLARIADPDAHDPDNIWSMLTKNLSARNISEDPYLPLTLAESWGIVPEHYNFLLDRSGFDGNVDWDAPYAPSCSLVREELGGKLAVLPEDMEENPFISVDPAVTRDWDDALSLNVTDAGYELTVIVACPALVWPFGDALDKAVLRRASSLYLPEGEHHMLPLGLCHGLFSLKAGTARPLVRVRMTLDKGLNLVSTAVQVARGFVTANLSLEESELSLSGQQDSAYAGLLRALYDLSLGLRAKRIEAGAVITERSDPEITLQPDAQGRMLVDIIPGANYERSHLIVGEVMVLCNRALASWAHGRGIPLIYRTQVAALPKESAGVWIRPDEVNRVLKSMPPARLSADPKPHAGVGAELYSSFTAPMRRYLDLLNQAQIVSFLQNGKARLDHAEIRELLPLLSARLDSTTQIQRFRTRYWKLVYLQQQEHEHKGELRYHESVITDDNNSFVTVALALTGLVLRGPRALFGDRVSIGGSVGVRVGKINPVRNEIQIMEVVDY